ncbi:hypothetical protein Dimus_030557, partial [Dionaea muscipula]
VGVLLSGSIVPYNPDAHILRDPQHKICTRLQDFGPWWLLLSWGGRVRPQRSLGDGPPGLIAVLWARMGSVGAIWY